MGVVMKKQFASVFAASLVAVASAQAADLKAPIVKAPPAPIEAPFSWTGFYIGANVGGAWTSNNAGSDFGPLFPPFALLPPVTPIITVIPGLNDVLVGGGRQSGIIGGGQIGYNWQVNQFVLGFEADAVGTGLKGSTGTARRDFGGGISQTITVDFGRIDWMASFRGRAGFAVDRALFYVTGGAAVAEFGGTTTTLVNGPAIGLPAGTFVATTGGNNTRWGWTVGGGIEYAFNQNWSVAGEYRHTDFGRRATSFTIPDGLGGVFAVGTSSQRLTVDQATLRLNYRFGAPGPVVARY